MPSLQPSVRNEKDLFYSVYQSAPEDKNKEIEKYLDAPTTITGLDLGTNALSAFPEAVFKCTFLNTLDFNVNSLSTLPMTFNFKYLENLDLSDNRFQQFPIAITSCSLLKKLFLHNNEIESVPRELGSLKHLSLLSLQGNPLSSFPVSIFCLRKLEHLHCDDAACQDPAPSSKVPSWKSLAFAGLTPSFGNINRAITEFKKFDEETLHVTLKEFSDRTQRNPKITECRYRKQRRCRNHI
ncbi:hypothetical protein DID78_04055 [Candidatus Marinamargulisbacteria bacterium SCGC AG-343-D04]|nr:hypothetical protein DID78_04055 [Candidatus Marinamargulisbacteria bacterium SCGC AG-343-D04]